MAYTYLNASVVSAGCNGLALCAVFCRLHGLGDHSFRHLVASVDGSFYHVADLGFEPLADDQDGGGVHSRSGTWHGGYTGKRRQRS